MTDDQMSLFFQMHHFSNKSNDMTMRVSSLEYLGQIASRLRKDAVSSRMDQDVLNTISKEVSIVSCPVLNKTENYLRISKNGQLSSMK